MQPVKCRFLYTLSVYINVYIGQHWPTSYLHSGVYKLAIYIKVSHNLNEIYIHPQIYYVISCRNLIHDVALYYLELRLF